MTAPRDVTLPQYNAVHKEQAKRKKRPLFTFDLYHYPGKGRYTVTGVLSDKLISGIRALLQSAKAGKP